jgi:hypothetical protein
MTVPRAETVRVLQSCRAASKEVVSRRRSIAEGPRFRRNRWSFANWCSAAMRGCCAGVKRPFRCASSCASAADRTMADQALCLCVETRGGIFAHAAGECVVSH